MGAGSGLALALCAALLAVVVTCPLASAQVLERVAVTIRTDGVVVTEISGHAAEGINEFALPVEPVPASIEVYLGGVLVPTIYVNGSLFVPSNTTASFTARYVVSTSVVGNELRFSVREDGEVTLVAEPGVVLTSLPARIVNTKVEDGKLILTFVGPAEVSYTLAEAKLEEVPAPTPVSLEYVAVAAVAALVAILLLYRSRRRPARTAKRELNETDTAILRKLEALGGSALQSELQDALGIPKTTLWRRIKRLEKLGYVGVKRENRTHRVFLKAKV